MGGLTVLHVLNHVHSSGNGIVNSVVDLSCEQVKRGDRVVVASRGGGFVDLLEAKGVRHVELDQARRLSNIPRARARLRRLVEGRDVDVVHAHMNYTTLLCRAALVGTKTPLVATAHTSFKRSASLLAVADRVIAVSDRVAEEMRRRGCRAAKLDVVPNGTIGSVRHEADPVAIDLDGPAIVMVGGMYERKGVDVLLRAFAGLTAAVPEAVLHLVGEGPDRARFEAMAAELVPSDRVRFHGFQADPRPFLAAADVFVLPSRHDPSPLVIVEAREAGCAIVASAVDGIPQACDWGEAGLLVEPGDPAALAEAMRRVLLDPEERVLWQRRARRGLEAFSMRRVASDVDRVYRTALGASA